MKSSDLYDEIMAHPKVMDVLAEKIPLVAKLRNTPGINELSLKEISDQSTHLELSLDAMMVQELYWKPIESLIKSGIIHPMKDEYESMYKSQGGQTIHFYSKQNHLDVYLAITTYPYDHARLLEHAESLVKA